MNEINITCLKRISSTPIDSSDAILSQYPAFKLGVARSVQRYAELMFPLFKKLIASDSKNTDWILTAPAIIAGTPSAANLLCWELFRLCQQEQGLGAWPITLIDIRLTDQSTGSKDWGHPTTSQDYAKLDYAARVIERKRISEFLGSNDEFRGRPVMFVNDICVTGIHQQSMQQYFDRTEAACVRWLYVIVVEQELGRLVPQIEGRINFLAFEDLLRMVSCEQIQFTTKCVNRLMGLSVPELDQIVRALDGERREQLLRLAVLNGFSRFGGFERQMETVRSYVETGSTVDDNMAL